MAPPSTPADVVSRHSHDATGQPTQVTYLSELDNTTGGLGRRGPYSIDGEQYNDSFKKYCGESRGTQDPSSWNVAGYLRMTAIIGIADDEEDALGAVAQVSIQDQDGQDLIEPFDVSLGASHEIDIDLQSAVQLQIRCAGSDRNGDPRGLFYVTFGDAALHR